MIATATHKVGDPLAFYEVAATVIPVLLLALIFQSNVIEKFSENDSTARLLLAPFYFGVALFGEASALHALVSQHPTQGAQARSVVSLLLLGIWLVLAQMFHGFSTMVEDDKAVTRKAAFVKMLGVLAALAVICMWSVEMI
jgi:hypothetical protein